MARYELVIEEQQPTCGGKLPTKSTIETVETNDPVAYVRSLEPNGELDVHTAEDGTLVVQADHNGSWIKYGFTEE